MAFLTMSMGFGQGWSLTSTLTAADGLFNREAFFSLQRTNDVILFPPDRPGQIRMDTGLCPNPGVLAPMSLKDSVA